MTLCGGVGQGSEKSDLVDVLVSSREGWTIWPAQTVL